MNLVDVWPRGRICSACRRWKGEAEFPRIRGDVLDSWCSACRAASQKERRGGRGIGPFPLTCCDCGTRFEGRRRDQERCESCQREHARQAKNARQRRARKDGTA